jgi:hypothetical protein
MAEPKIRTDEIEEEAEYLGINYIEPDDHRFWASLDYKRQIIRSFKYHQPSPAQIERIAAIRNGHIELAALIMRNTSGCADQTSALRKLHECMMTCNKSIVCEVT